MVKMPARTSEILQKAIATFGDHIQMMKAIEEFLEISKELLRAASLDRASFNRLIDEIADARIVVESMIELAKKLGPECGDQSSGSVEQAIYDIVCSKLARLENRVDKVNQSMSALTMGEEIKFTHGVFNCTGVVTGKTMDGIYHLNITEVVQSKNEWFGKDCTYLSAQWGDENHECEPVLVYCNHKANTCRDVEGNCNKRECPLLTKEEK